MFEFRSVIILNVKDTISTEPRPTLFTEVEPTEQQSRWRETIISTCHVLHVKSCLELAVGIFAKVPNPERHAYSLFQLITHLSLPGQNSELPFSTYLDVTGGKQ